MKQKIFLSSPHLHGNEIAFIESTLKINALSKGENITGFENDLQNYLNEEVDVACLSSGTAAIHLALVQLGVVINDEVICQSMTFSASANPIAYQGAKPIFIDSEIETWNMCPNHLEAAIKDRIAKGTKPKAVIVVHLYGMPAKIEEIKAISKQYNIPIVEDAAEALGSTYKGRKCGTFGDFSILSFNGNKIITTSGGGAMVCNSKEGKEKTIFYATQARDQAPHYEHTHIGYNYRMSNISAGIGRGQMEVLDKHVQLRRGMNQFYKELFSNFQGITVFEEPNSDFFSNHWLSCILIDHEIMGFSREDLRLELLKHNIESRPLWKPMHLQPIFEKYDFYGEKVAENLFEIGLCLPSGSNLTEKHKAFIKKVIIDYINR